MFVLNEIKKILLNILTKMIDFYLGNIVRDGVIVGIIKDAMGTFVFFLGIYAIVGILGWLSNFYNFLFGERKRIRKGKEYEWKVAECLKKNLGVEVFQNILLPIHNNDTTEIDMAFVTNKGVFCVECKERGATFVSCENSNAEWKLNGKETMKNPFLQNDYHIRYLNEALKRKFGYSDMVIWNVVITNPVLECKQMGNISYKDMYVMSHGRILMRIAGNRKKAMKQFIKEMEKTPVLLSEQDVFSISNYLKSKCATAEELEAHVERRKESQQMQQM